MIVMNTILQYNESDFHYHFGGLMTLSSPEATQARWLGVLAAKGYRLTRPLRVIIEVLVQTPYALSAMEVFDQGRAVFAGLGLVTVYRSLEKLVQLGLVQRVHQPDGCQCYVRAAGGHQHLMLCTTCNRVEYFSGDNLTDLIAAISQRSGFRIDDHWLQLFGLCADCQRLLREASLEPYLIPPEA
jgi:Fe2+ or Zn2+ uptake regulation protein